MPRTTIFTCSIYPDLTRIWHHFIRRYSDPSQVAVLIYDCGSRLQPAHFPGARLVRHPNVEHGKKMLSVPNRAVFSFRPRGFWEVSLEGRTYPVMGTDSLVFKPEIIRREELSFSSRRPAPPSIRRGTGYYDTGDYAQEQLIRRGYELVFSEKEKTRQMIRAYTGVSCGFVNFARRGWFSRRYRLTHTRHYWAATLRQKMNMLERACGVAAAISLYRTLFDEAPQFADFFTFDELTDLAANFAQESERDEARVMVGSYHKLLQVLESAA
jgi:hypothetical protein